MLAGRSNVDLVAGGSTGSDAGCRRKVQLTVVCDRHVLRSTGHIFSQCAVELW